MQARFGGWIPILALACVVLLPALAAAQGQIVGQIRDESGGILPGVTVEASSPALIEKVKSGVTDDQGRYRIVDLRPGNYKLTFTLTGFSTLTRDGLRLSSDQTLDVNVDMKVGSLEETVTVSGQAPQVDVTQASRTTAITRDIIDSLPVSRNIMSIGVLAAGVRQGAPDIGGSNMTEQVSLRAHGLAGLDGEQLVEGMSIQSYEGASQSYFDDMLQSEISVMTAAIPADTTGGGIRLNSILKDGGNQISGAVFIGGSSGSWQANNIDDKLRARQIQSANGVGHVQQFTGSIGGPLVKDKVWWLMSARHQSSDQTIANVPQNFIATDGTLLRGLSDNYVRGPSVRLTWQATQKNKLAMFWQRWWKRKGKDFTTGQDPRSATQRNPVHAHHYVGDAKYTSPITNKMLIEAGFSTAEFSWLGSGQPGTTGFAPFSPEWYLFARRTDTALNINPLCAYATGCLAWVNNGLDERRENTRKTLSTAVSYVTGSHNLKFGVQHEFGPDTRKGYRNADLVENYSNGKPSTVTVSNTPYNAPGHVDFDNAVYVMDSWTLKRLTINPGVRVHWFKASALETSMPAGRFAPARFFPKKTLIDWGPDTTPRFSAAYDLFGNGKIALKANASRYYRRYNADAFQIYADAGHVTENRNWFDCDINAAGTGCSGVNLPTNGDGIAQDNEIGPGTATFGQKALRTAASGLQRQYNWEFTVGVQDQVASRLAVGWMMYKRRIGNIQLSDRTQIRPSDYAAFTLPMPDFSNDPTLAGVLNPSEILTVYNLNSAKRGVFGAPIVDTSAPNDQSLYTGFETNFSLRIPGSTLFGSWTSEHNISVFCDTQNDPNGTSTNDLYSGATVGAGGRFCDQRQFHVPFRNEFKLAGDYPIPVVKIDFGFVMQSFPGADRVITWQPANTLFPGGRTNTETIVLSKPGTLFQPRWNQLDVNFKKPFRYGKNILTLEVEYFNVLNANAVWTTNNVIGTSLGQVQSILPGRIPRLALQYKW
jgi:carboxypeptidase family protein